MIIYRVPHRVSAFGGGSDYRQFIRENGYGHCIGFAIDKYSYVSVKRLPKFHDYFTRVTYSEVEVVNNNRDIKHNTIRTAIGHMGMMDVPLEINYVSDLPGGVGLGSSSSLIVALVAALYYLRTGKDIQMKNLIREAFQIEFVCTGRNVGYQDICFSALGNLQEISFLYQPRPIAYASSSRSYQVEYHTFSGQVVKLFEEYGLLFYVGNHNSAEVVSKYVGKLAASAEQKVIRYLAEQASKTIRSRCKPEDLGWLLSQSWEMKRKISPNISSDRVDNLLTLCLENGAYGGKLCGGGGSGSIFILAPPDTHAEIARVMVGEACVRIPYKVSLGGCERILPTII